MARFEAFEDQGGHWRWRLIADNGLKVATSGESFYSESNALRAAATVKSLAPGATVGKAPTDMNSGMLSALARRRAGRY